MRGTPTCESTAYRFDAVHITVTVQSRTGTHKGEYLGVAPTGKRVTFNSTDIIKVRDGFMVEHWPVWPYPATEGLNGQVRFTTERRARKLPRRFHLEFGGELAQSLLTNGPIPG